MKLLVLDTETTGLLPRDRTDYDAYPHLVQLSLRTYDTETRVKSARNIIVDPGVAIPPEAAAIHGITDAIAKAKGVSTKDALLFLAIAVDTCDRIVAHNYDFDSAVVSGELRRTGLLDFVRPLRARSYCTMKEGVLLCRIHASRRDGSHYHKYPKLIQLYKHLFLAEPEHLHDAHVDTAATLRCYLKMCHGINLEPQEFGIVERS